jgi:hypothetical protein
VARGSPEKGRKTKDEDEDENEDEDREEGGGGGARVSETMSLTEQLNSILAKANGRSQIDVQDVAECEDLFLDARRSASLLSSEAGRGYLS